jgi:hypothetical protein
MVLGSAAGDQKASNHGRASQMLAQQGVLFTTHNACHKRSSRAKTLKGTGEPNSEDGMKMARRRCSGALQSRACFAAWGPTVDSLLGNNCIIDALVQAARERRIVSKGTWAGQLIKQGREPEPIYEQLCCAVLCCAVAGH